jgi:hypothetical protein
LQDVSQTIFKKGETMSTQKDRRIRHLTFLMTVLLALVLVSQTGSAIQGNTPVKPGIRITTVPPRGAGPDKMEVIAGTVEGVDFRQCKVVVYAHTDVWYVQPYAGSSDTSIGENGTWETDTHLGVEYAALLVRASYKPPSTTGSLPEVGASILAMAKVRAKG